MKLCFVNPPATGRVTGDLAPPLWALVLGALAEAHGHEATLIDLNLQLAGRLDDDPADVLRSATERTMACDPDLVLYSSMAVNAHVALALAAQVKRAAPNVWTVFGGAHFASIADDLLRQYPAVVDAVAMGEADTTFAGFLRAIQDGKTGGVPGFWTRSGHRNVRPPVAPAQHAVPRPAWHLAPLAPYFAANPRRCLDIDAGLRGCRFACRYCYSPGHQGRPTANARTERLVAEFQEAVAIGARHLFLVQDNFVNDPASTIETCVAIESARLPVRFQCYATLPQLTGEVIEALARAGCDGVYVGVDAVDSRQQRSMGKRHFRDSATLLETLGRCVSAGIRPTTAFLIDHATDNDITIEVALSCRQAGCSVRFNVLTLYPGTALASDARKSLRIDSTKLRLTMDLPALVVDNPLVTEAPHLFPFHATHRPLDVQNRLLVKTHALTTLARCVPGTLSRMAGRESTWDLVGRITADIDVRQFVAMDDDARRRLEMDRFDQVLSGSTRRMYDVERVTMELASPQPARVAKGLGSTRYRLRPLTVRRRKAETLVAVRGCDRVAVHSVRGRDAHELRRLLERPSDEIVEISDSLVNTLTAIDAIEVVE